MYHTSALSRPFIRIEFRKTGSPYATVDARARFSEDVWGFFAAISPRLSRTMPSPLREGPGLASLDAIDAVELNAAEARL